MSSLLSAAVIVRKIKYERGRCQLACSNVHKMGTFVKEFRNEKISQDVSSSDSCSDSQQDQALHNVMGLLLMRESSDILLMFY